MSKKHKSIHMILLFLVLIIYNNIYCAENSVTNFIIKKIDKQAISATIIKHDNNNYILRIKNNSKTDDIENIEVRIFEDADDLSAASELPLAVHNLKYQDIKQRLAPEAYFDINIESYINSKTTCFLSYDTQEERVSTNFKIGKISKTFLYGSIITSEVAAIAAIAAIATAELASKKKIHNMKTEQAQAPIEQDQAVSTEKQISSIKQAQKELSRSVLEGIKQACDIDDNVQKIKINCSPRDDEKINNLKKQSAEYRAVLEKKWLVSQNDYHRSFLDYLREIENDTCVDDTDMIIKHLNSIQSITHNVAKQMLDIYRQINQLNASKCLDPHVRTKGIVKYRPVTSIMFFL